MRLAAFHNPVARTVSNRDLPRKAAFKALLHCRVRCNTPSLLMTHHSLLPWAWFPFKVFLHRRSGLASSLRSSCDPNGLLPSLSCRSLLRRVSTARSACAPPAVPSLQDAEASLHNHSAAASLKSGIPNLLGDCLALRPTDSRKNLPDSALQHRAAASTN